jgi:hypothetical protein
LFSPLNHDVLHEMEHEGIDVTAPDRLTALSNVAALEILVTRSILRLFPDNFAGSFAGPA